jgi:hypothetical protein
VRFARALSAAPPFYRIESSVGIDVVLEAREERRAPGGRGRARVMACVLNPRADAAQHRELC